jgi:uncharacterized protein with HEPN domain
MNRDVTLYLDDIIENINDAELFIKGMTYQEFMEDKRTVNAAIRSIEVIGEATKHVPQDIRNKRRDIPWKDMAGMRDKCIHGYLGIDYEVVWTSIKDELPEIRPKIKSLLVELKTH